MRITSLTYTSLARLDLSDDDLASILHSARQFNALNAITGLLIFNGTHFLQVVEGPEPSIEELLNRLRADDRHHHIEVRDRHEVQERSFPDWSMELVQVQSDFFQAKDEINRALPSSLPSKVSDRILMMTQQISGTIDLRG